MRVQMGGETLKRRFKGWQNFRARDRYGRWGLVPKTAQAKPMRLLPA